MKICVNFEFCAPNEILCRGDKNSVSYGLCERQDNQFTRLKPMFSKANENVKMYNQN